MKQLRAQPLLAVDAVSVDLETTGLDVKSARIVQVGAIGLRESRIDDDSALAFLVNPGEPIPETSSAVHGIRDADVEQAVSPPEAVRRLFRYAGSRLWIGHSIGFDLAIIRAELDRDGETFARPATLDTRILGEIANPSLPDFSIETLCGWLDLEPAGRHDALGDARTVAQLFVNLVPHLRARNVRTFAEAEAACRRMTDALETHYRAGWEAPVAEHLRRDTEQVLARIDSYPYRHRIREIMAPQPKMIAPHATVLDAVREMTGARISSLFLGDEGNGYGIVTERDVMRTIASVGPDALEKPVANIAARPLVTVPADAFVYRAVGRMDRLKIRHLGVVDERGALVGALSARDLLRLRASEAINLGDAINVAGSPAELAAAWASLPSIASGLVGEDVNARDIAGVISRELGAA
ncbi:MAG TPA: exonuclease domain-containing protein, partial [Afifellaceae bacterium]|nr:exonuclease domain-containing protein [Afifellaceae bacterium]